MRKCSSMILNSDTLYRKNLKEKILIKLAAEDILVVRDKGRDEHET
jgi:hypothetical protein